MCSTVLNFAFCVGASSRLHQKVWLSQKLMELGRAQLLQSSLAFYSSGKPDQTPGLQHWYYHEYYYDFNEVNWATNIIMLSINRHSPVWAGCNICITIRCIHVMENSLSLQLQLGSAAHPCMFPGTLPMCVYDVTSKSWYSSISNEVQRWFCRIYFIYWS
jgi:hypothetical protein